MGLEGGQGEGALGETQTSAEFGQSQVVRGAHTQSPTALHKDKEVTTPPFKTGS